MDDTTPIPENSAEYAPGPLRRLGFWPRWFCRRFLSDVRVDPGAIEHIRGLAAQGTLVYVMRYRSLVDFLLVAFILLRENLPMPEFVSDVPTLLLRPGREIFATLWRRLGGLRRHGRELRRIEDREQCQRLVAEDRPVLVFMRRRAPRVSLFAGRRIAPSRVRSGTDYLREIVHARRSDQRDVFLVPLAVARGRGYRRKEWRFATLVYSTQEAPGEVKRLLSLLWNARESSITVGKDVSLREFAAAHESEGDERLVRRLVRALQIFLHREERLISGPTLLPRAQVRQTVLQGGDLHRVIQNLARTTGQPESQLWRRAEKYFDEIAANYSGTYFSAIEFAFNQVWPRLFHGFEHEGLEKVAECVKLHPVVLVPCHRSHFDYLILSYLFHMNYLSPPHIAAGINLSFWPLGPLFRGAGAYFIRRTFEGNDIYKSVFRNYLAFLIREGYTQEFFIEGGRSRTGKILTPKLGMLSAIVNAYIEGVRRDLYIVPVSISYERIVEEQAYRRELAGGEKEKESLWALVRARKLLRQKYGTVYITFADPISLGDTLGDLRGRFAAAADEGGDEKRRFVQKLGFRILREVNTVAVAGPSAVSSTVLLSSGHAAMRESDFVVAAKSLVSFLRREGVKLTGSLERTAHDFRESLAFLESAGLIEHVPGEESVIRVPAERRLSLDFYKNNTIHFFLLPSLLLRGRRAGRTGSELDAEVRWWLDLYRWEFALPDREALTAELRRVEQCLIGEGAVAAGADGAVNPDHPFVRSVDELLENFREAYWVVATAIADLDEAGAAQDALLTRIRKQYATRLLVGEVGRPEGNSSVTLGNALSRYAEMGYVQIAASGRGRERLVRRGPRFAEIAELADRLAPAGIAAAGQAPPPPAPRA